MALISAYKNILAGLGYGVDQKGLIYNITVNNTNPHPKLEGASVSLTGPTDNEPQLFLRNTKDPHGDGTLHYFHPFREKVTNKDDSFILQFMMDSAANRLNYIINQMLMGVATYVTGQTPTSPMPSPEGLRLIEAGAGIDKDFTTFILNLLSNKKYKHRKDFHVKLFLKKSGKIAGRTYSHACIVSFPFYEELCKTKSSDVFGITVKKAYRDALISLFEHIFPFIKEDGYYSGGSVSRFAPKAEAIMKAVYNISIVVNEVFALYKDYVPADQPIEAFGWTNTAFGEVLDNIESFRDEITLIPGQPSNESPLPTAPPVQQTMPLPSQQPVVTSVVQQAAAQQQTPVTAPPPPAQPQVAGAVKSSDYWLTAAGQEEYRRIKAAQSQTPPPPMYYQQPQQPMYYQQQQPPPPQYYQPPPPVYYQQPQTQQPVYYQPQQPVYYQQPQTSPIGTPTYNGMPQMITPAIGNVAI